MLLASQIPLIPQLIVAALEILQQLLRHISLLQHTGRNVGRLGNYHHSDGGLVLRHSERLSELLEGPSIRLMVVGRGLLQLLSPGVEALLILSRLRLILAEVLVTQQLRLGS